MLGWIPCLFQIRVVQAIHQMYYDAILWWPMLMVWGSCPTDWCSQKNCLDVFSDNHVVYDLMYLLYGYVCLWFLSRYLNRFYIKIFQKWDEILFELWSIIEDYSMRSIVVGQPWVLKQLAYSDKYFIDVFFACLDLFEVVIRELCDFDPTRWEINKVHTCEVQIYFFDWPPWLSLFYLDCIWTYQVYMHRITWCHFILSYVLGRRLTVVRDALLLGLTLLTKFGKLPYLVFNTFPVEYLFECIV